MRPLSSVYVFLHLVIVVATFTMHKRSFVLLQSSSRTSLHLSFPTTSTSKYSSPTTSTSKDSSPTASTSKDSFPTKSTSKDSSPTTSMSKDSSPTTPRSQGIPCGKDKLMLSRAKTRWRKSSSTHSSDASFSLPKCSTVKQAAAVATGDSSSALLTRLEDLPAEGLHDDHLDSESLLSEDHQTEDLDSESSPFEDLLDKDLPEQVPYEYGLLREVASLLVAVREEQLGRCAVAITTDHVYLSAVDFSLRYLAAVGDGQPQEQRQVSPVTLFTLPPPPYQAGGMPLWLVSRYRLLRRETCTHYIFLVSDPGRLLRLLWQLHQDSLHLLAKIVLVTHLRLRHLLHFLQAPPVSKMVKVLLVTPSAARGVVSLLLHTHLFFRGQERISLKRLGTWPTHQASPAKLHALQWFPEKLENFHGFKFQATTFNHPPVSIFEPQADGTFSYDGLEIRLLRTLASALNFTVEISRPRDGEKWGRRLANGSWTGAVGETVRGETDVSFANYFITADRLRIMDMTRPYYIDYTCFITPKPQPLPQYTAVAWPFHVWVWAAVLVTLGVVPPVVRAAGEVEPGSWFQRLDNAAWYVWGVFLTRSQPLQLVPSSSALRIVVISSWVAAMIISVAYKSSLIAFLLVPLPAQPVNTLEQLLQSGLHWGVRDRGGWDEWFSNSLDPTSQKIAAGFEFVKGIDGGLARVLEGDFAFMNSGTFLRYLVASNFTNEFGQTKLHVAKECFVPFRIGLGMPRSSVYTSRFNDIVARVVEAGMVSRWFQDLLDKYV